MNLLLKCDENLALLSDFLDERLVPGRSLEVRLHLLRCAPCRALLATLRVLPALVAEVETRAPVTAEAALAGALEHIARPGAPRPWPATPVPAEAQALLDAGADLPLAILAAAHRALAGSRLAEPDPSHLPVAIRGLLPPEDVWQWVVQPNGKRRVELLRDPAGGQKLVLAFSPTGAQGKPHRHLGSESILILAGSMDDRGRHLKAGDWIHHPTGSVHAPAILEEGDCWCLIREEGGTEAVGALARLFTR